MNQITKWYVALALFADRLKDRKGQTLVEYALLLALIAIIVIAVVTVLGQKTNNVYSTIGNKIGN